MEDSLALIPEEPTIYIYESGQTYDELYNEGLIIIEELSEIEKSMKKQKTSPINRLLTDIVGGLFIYLGTFIICDLIRTFREGEWTPLYWSFWGPWRYMTGAPLIKKIIGRYRDNHDTLTCKQGFDALSAQCSIYDKAYDSGSANSVVDQGKQLKTNIVNELIALGLPIVYDYTGNSGIEACNEISEIYLIRCQNKGLQGDAIEMVCQRQADNWMRETLSNAEQDYTVDWLLGQWLDQYNSCLTRSTEPPDGSKTQQQKCLDANESWLVGCNQLSYSPGECDYIYENNKKACDGNYSDIYGCSNLYEDLAQCYQTSTEPGIFCQSLINEVTDCERYEYNFADPNVNRIY